MMPRRSWSVVLGLVATLAAGPSWAQAVTDPVTQAFDLERRGNYAAAAEAYQRALRERPGDLAALLGLERSLLPLDRGAELLPYVRAALAASPETLPLYSVAMRAWAAVGAMDSVQVMAERWAAFVPGDETPYREWGSAHLSRRDLPGARRAFEVGRQRLGRPEVLAADLAQLAFLARDYGTAVREWLAAIEFLPGHRLNALNTLAQVPVQEQADLLRRLEAAGPTGRQLGGALRARWGEPLIGFRNYLAALPANAAQASELLRQFQEQLRGQTSREARRTQGMVFEALAERAVPGAAGRLRLEAAQAYADGGDPVAARRMLAQLAGDSAAPASLASSATVTLIEVLVAEGHLAEAERRLLEFGTAVSSEEAAGLRRRVASGWIQQGDLNRAEAVLAADSTVDGLALAGRIRLYRGDLAGATDRLKAAGPFTGSREEATERTRLLALIQPIQQDSLPELGAALLQLARGDSVNAVAGLVRLAGRLDPAAGGAELRLLAGRVEAGLGQVERAEALFRTVAGQPVPSAGAAADLELGRLLLGLGRVTEAVVSLEHLILTYPTSALVPQARRLLDQAREAVPRT